MPPKRPKKHKSQTRDDDSPRPSTSQAADLEISHDGEDDQPVSNTQASAQSKKVMSSLSKELVKKKVNELVQYLLIMDQKKYPVKRIDINKVVLKEHSRAFPSFMEEASVILKEVFGIDLVEVDSKAKAYILVNRFEQDVEHPLEWPPKDNMKMALVMVILSVIFMKGNVISDVELYHFLKKLGVDVESNHDAFGDVKKLITSEFVRQGYLEMEKQKNTDPPSFEYRWGFRANQEISKRYALDFVCQIYGVDTPELWSTQYQDMLESEGSPMEC